MTDVYANIGDAERAIQERLAAVLELRAADPQQRAIVDDYLRDVDIAPAARALDVGCGTGFVTRVLAGMPTVASVTGVDLSPVFVAKARELAAAQENADFQEADARALPFSDADFDLVVFHTTLTHVPEPERALAEAFRVMRPGGWVTVCDGDYSTLSVANGDWDPLQACIEAVKGAFINDLWVTRRMPALLRAAGFHLVNEEVGALSLAWRDTAGIIARMTRHLLPLGAVALCVPALIALQPEGEAVRVPLNHYLMGHATGDPSHMRKAFLPTAHIEGVREGKFVSWTLDEYCARFSGRPEADESTRRRTIDSVDVTGNAAMARATLVHGATTFTDYFVLVKVGDDWKIANKVYTVRRANE